MTTNLTTPAAPPAAVDRRMADFDNNSSASLLSSHAGHVIVCHSHFPIAYLTRCITSVAGVINTASLSGTATHARSLPFIQRCQESPSSLTRGIQHLRRSQLWSQLITPAGGAGGREESWCSSSRLLLRLTRPTHSGPVLKAGPVQWLTS